MAIIFTPDCSNRELICRIAPAAQVVVEVSTKLVVNEIKCERVDCWVDKREAEECRFEDVPIGVVVDVSEMPEEKKGLTR